MTDPLILQGLAREAKTPLESIRAVCEMLDAGLSAPFIGRFRREQTGGLFENQIRRLAQMRAEMAELDRRRATVLKALEASGASEATLKSVRVRADRFELEDQYLPFRRPEPEVQLALDRGLGGLADALVKPLPRAERSAAEEGDEEEHAAEPEGLEGGDESSDHGATSEPVFEAKDEELATGEDAGEKAEHFEPTPDEEPSEPHSDGSSAESGEGESTQADSAGVADLSHMRLHADEMLTPELARLCSEFVNPDRGVHSEVEALSGAMRILADRLGRNPALRSYVRGLMRKHGELRVRPLTDEKRAGRHKALFKLRGPLRQLQGPRLTALRQAQKERVLSTTIHLDPGRAVGRVRSVLGKHTRPEFGPLLNAIAIQALEQRLIPNVEADVRLELKERGDREALRALTQQLRAMLLAPCHGPLPMVGIDISARGDWIVAAVDRQGQPVATLKIEKGEKEPAAMGRELLEFIADSDPRAILLAGGRGGHERALAVRGAARLAGLAVPVLVTNDAGLSGWAGGERGRKELPEHSVPERAAISLARRGQDPMAELLKVDPWQLSMGSDQGLVSKASLHRALQETVESCVALVGCRVNSAPRAVLQALPGLDQDAVDRLLARRAERPIRSREELRSEGLLSEAQWTSVAAFLRVPESADLLDRTSLHPEQYALAQRVLESVGTSVEEGLGRPGVTKGLRREEGIDEGTWRDLMRELAFPGRDPRPRNRLPELLDPATDALRLTVGRVVEGVVVAVSGFGAFVDVGLEQEAVLRAMDLGRRYLRNAREELAAGSVVRAVIKESGDKRLVLSVRDVPPPERAERPERGARGDRAGRGERGDRGPRRGREGERPQRAPQRPGDARGMALGGGRDKGRRGGPGGRDERGGRPGDGERGERVDLRKINADASAGVSNTPFARFFKKGTPAESEPEQAATSSPDNGASGPAGA